MENRAENNQYISQLIASGDKNKYIEGCQLLRLIELEDHELKPFLTQKKSPIMSSIIHQLSHGTAEVLDATLSAFVGLITGFESAEFIFHETKTVLFARRDLNRDSFWDYLTVVFLNTFHELDKSIIETAVTTSSSSSLRFVFYYFDLKVPAEIASQINASSDFAAAFRETLLRGENQVQFNGAFIEKIVSKETIEDSDISDLIVLALIVERYTNLLDEDDSAVVALMPQLLALAVKVSTASAVDLLAEALDDLSNKLGFLFTNFGILSKSSLNFYDMFLEAFFTHKLEDLALCIASMNQTLVENSQPFADRVPDVLPILEASLRSKSESSYKYLELLLSFLPCHNLDENSARKMIVVTNLALSSVTSLSVIPTVTLLATLLTEEQRLRPLSEFNALTNSTMKCNMMMNRINCEQKEEIRATLGECLAILRKK